MRLSKQEMVDQFELITKQEIKNHNDQILASNVQMNILSDQVECASEAQTKALLDLSLAIKDLCKRMDSIEKDLEERTKDGKLLHGKLQVLEELNQADDRQSAEEVLEIFALAKQQSISIDKVMESIADLKGEIAKKERDLSGTFLSRDKMRNEALELLKNDLLSRPCKSIPAIKELEKRTDACERDSHLFREGLRANTDRDTYDRKKIEHLMMITERIHNRMSK